MRRATKRNPATLRVLRMAISFLRDVRAGQTGYVSTRLMRERIDKILSAHDRPDTRSEFEEFAGDTRRALHMDELREALDARKRKNPRAGAGVRVDRGTMIYPRVLAIHAQRRRGSKTVYVHKFDTVNPVVGLPDGSILIPRGDRPLWGEA